MASAAFAEHQRTGLRQRANSEIVDHDVARYRPVAADHDAQFAFVIESVGPEREGDLPIWRRDRTAELSEHRRVSWQFAPDFGGVIAVIEANAQKGAGSGDRRQKALRFERHRWSGMHRRSFELRSSALEQFDHGFRQPAQIDDPIVLDARRTRTIFEAIGGEFHRDGPG